MTYIITTIITIVLIVIATFNGITIFCVHDIVVSTFLAAGLLASFKSALPLEIKEFIYKPRDATPNQDKMKAPRCATCEMFEQVPLLISQVLIPCSLRKFSSNYLFISSQSNQPNPLVWTSKLSLNFWWTCTTPQQGPVFMVHFVCCEKFCISIAYKK